MRLRSSFLTIVRITVKTVLSLSVGAEGDIVLFVAYTEREGRIRIISARRATKHEQDHYFSQNA